jgi:hypothetical protein
MLAFAPLISSPPGSRSEYEIAMPAWPAPVADASNLPPWMIELRTLTWAFSAGAAGVAAHTARVLM